MKRSKNIGIAFLIVFLLTSNYNLPNIERNFVNPSVKENNELKISSQPKNINVTLLSNFSFVDEYNLTINSDYDYFSDLEVNISSIEYRTKFENKFDIVGVNTSIINGTLIANQSDISQFQDNNHSTDGVWVEASGNEVELDVKISVEITNNRMDNSGELVFSDYYELIVQFLNITLETIDTPTSFGDDNEEVAIGDECFWNVSLMYQNDSLTEELPLNLINQANIIEANDIFSQNPTEILTPLNIPKLWNYNDINFSLPNEIPLQNFTQYSINNGFNNQSGTWNNNPVFTFRIWVKSIGNISYWSDTICRSKIKINELYSKHQFKWNESSKQDYNSEWDFYIQNYEFNQWQNNSIDPSGYDYLFNGFDFKKQLFPYNNILLKSDIYDSYEYVNITLNYLNTTLWMLPPEESILSSKGSIENAISSDGNIVLNWTSSLFSDNYTLYGSDKMITEINGTVILIEQNLINNSYLIENKTDGVYFYILYAFNVLGNISSNCLEIIVGHIPSLFTTDSTEIIRGTVYLNWSEPLYTDNYSIIYAFDDGNGLKQYLVIEGYNYTNYTISNLIGGFYIFLVMAKNQYGTTYSLTHLELEGISIPSDDDDKTEPIELNWVLLIIILSIAGGGIGIGVFLYYRSKRNGTIFKTKFKS